MRRSMVPLRFLALAFVLGWSLSHSIVFGQNEPAKEAPKAPAAAEKIRKTLDQILLLDYEGQSLEEAMRHLKEKTQIHFMVDQFALQNMGIPVGEVPMQVSLKGNGIKVRQALQRMLNPYGLTYVVLDDGVLVTTEDFGIQRQMRQRTPVDVKDVPLHKALRDLAKQTGVNLVIDPRVMKQAQASVSLEVEDATVETAMRLLAELGDLKAVRMGNVLFVTNDARAEKIRREESPQQNLPGVAVGELLRAGNMGVGGGVVGVPGVVPALPPGAAPAAPAAPPIDKDPAP
jgi:type II secretory pathway component GspD/PulD (secretin)